MHHIPEGLMDRKREEFCNFTQARLTVDAYSREFGNLARYAPEEVSTDAKKQARFRKGLSPELRHDLRLHECTSSRSWSIRPSVLRQVRLTMTPHASTLAILVHHPAPDLRSAGSGFQTLLCHLGSLRGHPSRRLAPTSRMHRPRSMVAPLLMLLHAPML